ncbi:MAG: TfoX/Sxy family protein [Chloroflexi bacterium]|nr:TfoX/Sxy family protein [Chloroflexota bacterium]
MAADSAFRDRVLELLAPLGLVTSRSMFGGYGIFAESSMFALIAGEGLFFKVDDTNRARYEEAGSKQYRPMPYYRVPADVLEDEDRLLDWARVSVAIARAAPKKRRRWG